MTETFITTFPTTPSPTWTLPRFTPPPECLDTNSIWNMETDCYSGTAQGLYRTTRTCNYLWLGYTDYPHTTGGPGLGLNGFCGPGWSHPATECPVGYTPAHTVDYTPDATTSREILCCLTGYDFEWSRPTLTDQSGSSATPYDKFCIASNLKPSGTSPLTLTAFDLSSASSLQTDIRISTTIKFDPEKDLLLASAVTISYQINSGGTTCVPDCDDPYTGGPWPRPAQTVTPAPESSRSDSGLVGLEKLVWVGIAFGIVVGLGIIACIGCRIHRSRKGKRMGATSEAQGHEGEVQDQDAIAMEVPKGKKVD
ncbi:hypothetical protein FOPG_10387 [Fusarium oxysporum f. sp. conglutinans race 2 54008]|uniref:Uncharacterized protein n=1 Tax=Fusarium oxysporum f. sp. conglutinans race 2 54008 TaxID=1089457 RepID=X0IN42_FUSOX|nr:hypothetical protein FOPG_10387 [Fusarium oxysporum f. sp. conglutinans race 2 54008]KAI8403928.1 hypothetical protein FOFC_15421 [Fusarium oxysporum]